MNPFPGIENIITNEMVHRSLGDHRDHQAFGAGFMNKSGVTQDCTNQLSPYYVMVYVLQGKGRYYDVDGSEYALAAGDVFQRFPVRSHSTVIDPASGWRECFIVLGREFYQCCRTLRVLPNVSPVVGIGVDRTLIKRIWRLKEEFKQSSDEDLPLLVHDALGVAIELHRRMETARSTDRDNRMIAEICELLGRDFHQHLELPEICQEYGCGYENFRKRFREQLGISPGQYRIRRRLDTACELLAARCHSISEIAWMLGYSSPFEFSAQFKNISGSRPGAMGARRRLSKAMCRVNNYF